MLYQKFYYLKVFLRKVRPKKLLTKLLLTAMLFIRFFHLEAQIVPDRPDVDKAAAMFLDKIKLPPSIMWMLRAQYEY